MRTITDRIGYSLILIGFIAMIFKYGNYLLYETIYLINGNVVYVEIKSKEIVNGKNIYYFILYDGAEKKYSSIPTNKVFLHEKNVKARTVPLFQKVFLGEFVLSSYVIGLTLLVFGLLISILSFWLIFGIENRFTQRINHSKRGS